MAGAALALPAAYLAALAAGTATALWRQRDPAALLLPAALAAMHLAWGAGFCCPWPVRRRARPQDPPGPGRGSGRNVISLGVRDRNAVLHGMTAG